MSDPAGLHQALQSAVELRDKVVVLRLTPAALAEAEPGLAAALAVLRGLGLRLVVVCDAVDSGLGQPYALAPALRLIGALTQKGQRAVSLPAAGVVTAHPAPLGTPAPASGAAPRPLLMVDPILLTHLGSLGYITLLLLPVVDAAGAVSDVAADEVAAAVGMFLDAALLVFVRAAAAPPLPATTAGRRTVVLAPAALDELVSAVLLAGRPGSEAPARRGRRAR